MLNTHHFPLADFKAIQKLQTAFMNSGNKVRLACGEAIAMGPLFLDTMFHHLDKVHPDTKQSLDRFDIASMACTCFLQAFFYENFPTAAPGSKTFATLAAVPVTDEPGNPVLNEDGSFIHGQCIGVARPRGYTGWMMLMS